MVVQHNLTAMNSNRMLNLTVKSQADSTEKLSSGFKINRAADDAAGLSISEKMRKQIRGLTQASSNAQDGISMVQTAEGALNEVQDMLQRLNELAVKAANGTLSSDDRGYIQNEVDQIMSEIDRVAATTKFNETYLLDGSYDVKEKDGFFGALSEELIGTNVDLFENHVFGVYTGTQLTDVVGTGNIVGGDQNGTAVNAGGSYAAGFLDLTGINSAADVEKLMGTGISATCTLCDNYYSLKFVDDDTPGLNSDGYKAFANESSGTTMWVSISGCNNGTDVTNKVLSAYAKLQSTTYTAGNKNAYCMGTSHHVNIGGGNGKLAIFDGDTVAGPHAAVSEDYTGSWSLKNGYLGKGADITLDNTKLSLHVGADATKNNQIELELGNLSGAALGLQGYTYDWRTESLKAFNAADVTTADKALKCIDAVKEAIQSVSTQRSRFGAVQNRLEHTINNLDNVVENTTSAESAIRDTDMATEMVKYSNNNILAQAGQAMLAQSNQANQGVLSLLG